MPNLPVPDTDALAQSSGLAVLIEREIASAGGWISFHRYMELALYAPGLGYYSGGTQKFGKGGDFITAPELTTLFGQTLAAQVAEIMRASHPAVIEAGAGSGVLAIDLLRELERLDCLPEFYGILELSAQLRARQRQTISALDPQLASRVVWLDAPPETFSGVLVGNEVLDAIPTHVVAAREGGFFERGVACRQDGAFVWADRPARGRLLAAAQKLPLPTGMIEEGGGEFVTEINLAAAAWIADWGARLRHGALLLFDYGYPRDEFCLPFRARGTLKCHYCHRAHEDPFLWPGLNDITSSVDFTAMAEAGFDAGLDVLGYASQGQFLLNCGLLEYLAGRGPEGSAEYARASVAAQKLTLPNEMGELFKVLALGRGVATDVPLMGFARGDRTHVL
ncbi:MAG: SAM-dependent methyltransferase [Betaproteobacteria bacterium]|nr:SAM-dependent methyltransferase [Betaproteobacteria bacterium]MCL2162322.1 SAM-dependent methyltransferase [Betaproteobacteria bacterium]